MTLPTRARAELARDIGDFAFDPLGHAIYAYPWATAALPADGPRQWQAEILSEIGEHLASPLTRFTPLRIAVASGHGIGKSAEISMILKWALDTCPDTRIVITANTEAQLVGKTMAEVSKWSGLSITSDWFKASATAVVSAMPGHERSWRADAVTWSIHNADAFAGLHNQGKRIVVIFDEASSIADRIWEVTEGALTDEDTEIIWLAFGNPTRNSGRFKDCFGRFSHLWRTRQIDSRTVEGTNRAYLDEIVSTYGVDSDIARVRVRGMFPSTSSLQFISSDVVAAARKREIGHYPGQLLRPEPVIFGLDHARFGDDQSVLAIRQGRDAASRTWRRWQGADSLRIANDVIAEADRHKPDAIFVDAGGPNAGGIIDQLRRVLVGRAKVYEINFGPPGREANWNDQIRVKTANRSAEMWTNMRAWLETGSIPDEQRIEDELTGREYDYGADQSTITLEKKKHMKARGLPSPDNADALALTFAERVGPRNPRRDSSHFYLDDFLKLKEQMEAPRDRYAELDL